MDEAISGIVRREAHEAAFRELVRRLDALPDEEARALVEELAPRIEGWPVETRRVVLTPRGTVGPAARKLARSVRVEWGSASGDPRLVETLQEMTDVVAVELMPLDDDAAGWIAKVPGGTRSVSLFASPPRREAEAWAARTADALGRLGALDSIALAVGHATPFLTVRVLERPLVSFSARIAELADPSALRGLEPLSLRSLTLHPIDGVPSAWAPGAVAALVARFPELIELTSPWVDPSAFEGLRSLARLCVVPMGTLDSADVERLFASLPLTLRRLAVPGLPGDTTLTALARCPHLEEISWRGNRFSPAGVRSLLASGALERLTSIELNGALERKEARLLFEEGAPRCLRNLDLFGLALGDATIRALARSPAWLERLVSLDVQSNELSSKGLASLVDALVEHADSLVSLAVDGNRVGPDTHEGLARLAARGVAMDVELPANASTRGSAVAPASAVEAAWSQLDAWLTRSGANVPGLAPPAKASALARATHLPPSLRASYAAHDGGDDTELLGLGRIVWWPLAEVADAEPEERDERAFIVFAAPLEGDGFEPGELPALDDEHDSMFAIASDTEEVVQLGRRGSITVVAEHLASPLEAVLATLEDGTRTLDENGRLQGGASPSPQEPRAPLLSPVEELATALLGRHVIELRQGATVRDLAAAFDAAVTASTPKARVRALLSVFDSALVDEVFVDDDTLHDLATQLARQFS